MVWLPHFMSSEKAGQLGRLLKINYLLERDRLDGLRGDLSDGRPGAGPPPAAGAAGQPRNRSSRRRCSSSTASRGRTAAPSAPRSARTGTCCRCSPATEPRLARRRRRSSTTCSALADGLFATLYPKHPDFDPAGNRKAVTPGELRTVLAWITKAMEDGERRAVVDRKACSLVLRRIVHPLELGEVADGPLTSSSTGGDASTSRPPQQTA